MPWGFCCLPKEGSPILNADSKAELEAQIEVGGLNSEEKEKVVMVNAFNEWLEKHGRCTDFGIEVDEVQNLIPDIVMRIRHGGAFVND